jgi:ABC-type multidrug transport system permease subunit
MTIFKFAVLRGVRTPAFLLANFAVPLALIFIRDMWTNASGSGFYLFGFLLIYGSLTVARGILNDKQDGTVIRILAGPVTTLRYLAENLLACVTPMAVQIIAVVTIGSFLHGWQVLFALSLALCYIIFVTACVSFVFAWSCLFKTKEVSNTVFVVAAMFMAVLGGLTLPLDMLPEPLRYFGAVFPTYWLSTGINALRDSGVTGEYWLSLGAIALFAAAYLLYGGKRRII